MRLRLPDTLSAARRRDDGMLSLINIVFLLMIFFMMLGSVTAPDPFALEPASAAALARSDAGADVLSVAADGRLGLAGEAFEAAALSAHLRDWLASNPEATMSLRADRAADANRVLDVMAMVKAAGVERVRLLAADAPPDIYEER